MPKVFAVRVADIATTGALGVGGLVTVVYLSASFAQLAGGWLADKVPLKPLYVASYLAQAPIFMVAAVAGGPTLLIAAAAMVSLNVGTSPAETALIAHYSPARWRATAFGAKFAVALGVSALGVPLVAFIFDPTGDFYWLYAILAGLAAIVGVAALILPSTRHEPGAAAASAAPGAAPGTVPGAAPAPSQGD